MMEIMIVMILAQIIWVNDVVIITVIIIAIVIAVITIMTEMI